MDWLVDSGHETAALDRTAACLTEFLVRRIDELSAEWSEAPIVFWHRIPDVRSCCSTSALFEQPLAAEAYAYVHFLERYRRTWSALKHLTNEAVLPLGSEGVRALDIGAGPAPSLYAADDFYQALTEFARLKKLDNLVLPEAELNIIERSEGMSWFVHSFSEFCRRRGPFGSVFKDFRGLDLHVVRASHQRQNEYVEEWDPETEQYEEVYASASDLANRLFRYRLVVLSNFLTLDGEVDSFREELTALFGDLRPGAVVIVLGATGDGYQRMYEQIAKIANESRLNEGGWHSDALGQRDLHDEVATRIKVAQHRVYEHLEHLVGSHKLEKTKAWPDYWSPVPSLQARPRFALRVFRRGRWPIPARP